MLNRRLLRIKIFQALYGFYQSGSDDLKIAEKNLFTSLNAMHELLFVNISLLLRLARMSEERFEMSNQKFIKRERDNASLRRFSDNEVIKRLDSNEQVKKIISNYKINWGGQDNLLKKIIRAIEDSEEYQAYQSSETTIKDSETLRHLYNDFIMQEPLLLNYLEEDNMHWVQDQIYIGSLMNTMLKKKSFMTDNKEEVPGVFKEPDFKEAESDHDFVKKLFSQTILHEKEYEEVIFKYIENWEPDRIALSDMIIMKMACAEIITFDQIPLKSSLNEYIELSKAYSTPKSKIFVNGVLDKAVSHLQREGKIIKTGRGLKENS